MDTSPVLLPAALGAGLLVLRLVLGLYMAAHGAQKLFGWFGGHGLRATGEYMVHLGFHPPRAFATAAAATELVSGLVVALGLLGPVGPALMLPPMIVAIAAVHWRGGLFAQNHGIELPLLFAAGAVGLALTGPGPYALDALLGLDVLMAPWLVRAALAAGVVGGLANLAIRRPAPGASPAP